MEKSIILCDTNILIEFYKNNQNIIAELEKIGSKNIALSVVTAGELLFGALNKKETKTIKKRYRASDFNEYQRFNKSKIH